MWRNIWVAGFFKMDVHFQTDVHHISYTFRNDSRRIRIGTAVGVMEVAVAAQASTGIGS